MIQFNLNRGVNEMFTEDTFYAWTKPSSDTEQQHQEKTEKQITAAIKNYKPFSDLWNSNQIKIYGKGSYANNTNVRRNSDIDIVVERKDSIYWEAMGEFEPVFPPAQQGSYNGPWSFESFHDGVRKALESFYGSSTVDSSGNVALHLDETNYTVNADIVPCSSLWTFISPRSYYEGTRLQAKNGKILDNYPLQQLKNGVTKNNATNHNYKKLVRIVKRMENHMVEEGIQQEIPSYLIECLVYLCPNSEFNNAHSWDNMLKRVLAYLNSFLNSPSADEATEINEIKYLFHPAQKWNKHQAKNFVDNMYEYVS